MGTVLAADQMDLLVRSVADFGLDGLYHAFYLVDLRSLDFMVFATLLLLGALGASQGLLTFSTDLLLPT